MTSRRQYHVPLQCCVLAKTDLPCFWVQSFLSASKDSKRATLEVFQPFLWMVRFNVVRAKLGPEPTFKDLLLVFSNSPIGLLARAMQPEHVPEGDTWTSTFRHQLLIFFTIFSIEVTKSVQTGKPLEWTESEHLQHTRSVLLSPSLIAEVSRDHPETAREMTEKLLSSVLGSTRETSFPQST